MDKTMLNFQSQLATLHRDFIKQFLHKYQKALSLIKQSTLKCMDQGIAEFDIDLEKLNLDMSFNDFNQALQVLSMDATQAGTAEDWDVIFQIKVKPKALLHIDMYRLVSVLSLKQYQQDHVVKNQLDVDVKKLFNHYNQYLENFIRNHQLELLELGSLIQDKLTHNQYDMIFSNTDLDFNPSQILKIYQYLQWRLLRTVNLKTISQLISCSVTKDTWELHLSILALIKVTEKQVFQFISAQSRSSKHKTIKPDNKQLQPVSHKTFNSKWLSGKHMLENDTDSSNEWNIIWRQTSKCPMCNKIFPYYKRPRTVGKDDLVVNSKHEYLLRISFYNNEHLVETRLSGPIKYCPNCGRKLSPKI